MQPVIHFRSSLFDIELEPKNPINPIAGSSLLEWLRQKIQSETTMTAIEAEDWGWYSYVMWKNRKYLIGACALVSQDGNHEWILQIDKHRSLKERLLGQSKMDDEDPCFDFFKNIVESEPSFTEMTVEMGP